MDNKSLTISASLQRTSVFLRRQVWVWPVAAAVLLAVVGWIVRNVVEDAVKSTMADNLQTILNADVAALQLWLKTQQANASAVAEDDSVRQPLVKLAEIAAAETFDPSELQKAAELATLRRELEPWIASQDYNGFVAMNAQGVILAAMRGGVVGRRDIPIPKGLLQTIFEKERATVTRPFSSSMLLENEDGVPLAGVPTMFTVAPVRDDEGKIVAGLGLRIRPEGDFTRILSVGRAGQSGETYAFDQTGIMLSRSRFEEQLVDLGLLREGEQSILKINIRDPQVDLTSGRRATVRRSQQPLTRMAADAAAGNSNVDVAGYRDYRGVPVVGAWTWLDSYQFGVATEMDMAEGYRPLYLLRYTFWGLFALLAIAALAIFIFTLVVARMDRAARIAASKIKKLGQYALDEEIGAGGMGVVYRGHHAMLRRATAIKLLDAEKTTDQTIQRFEREVQLTSQLNHPNTIAVYDYGRTPEGVFYYAMEYLEGKDLQKLVQEHGPQPPGRVIHILRQLCGSLHEAHGIGLIHRDVKPANIILNQRGGMSDVVKLLDFGLVKAVDARKQATLTSAGSLTGTPLYMSPESINSPNEADGRSDLYAVAAVGYFLLTAQPLFDGESVVEICMHQVRTKPTPPGERLAEPLSADLENVILRGLEKDADDRFRSAREFDQALAACVDAANWDEDRAAQWWARSDEFQPPRDAAVNETIILNNDTSE